MAEALVKVIVPLAFVTFPSEIQLALVMLVLNWIWYTRPGALLMLNWN